jgi:hypothetical protein
MELSITKLAAGEGALAVVPAFSTSTESCAPWVNCVAATLAVSCVLLTNVVGSDTLPTCTTEVLRKPVPVTVSTTAAEPAGIVVGATEVTVEGAAGVPELLPEELVEEEVLEGDEQPDRTKATARHSAANTTEQVFME